MFGSKDLLFSSEKYGVAKSLRFRSGSSTYLNRTFGTPTSTTTFTWSGWVKRGQLSSANAFAFFAVAAASSGNVGTTPRGELAFYQDNLLFTTNDGTGAGFTLQTTQVFRDPSSWYHLTVAVDTSQSTNTNRIKIYVNGNLIPSSAYGTATWPTLSQATIFNGTGTSKFHSIGMYANTGDLFDGYLAEVNFIDGQALTPSAFGFYDNNGIWQPQGYTGTYGNNGFYLKFTDVGATSGANSGYGKDFSGFNTNYWTTNNFNSTSTSTSYDSMYDSPVNASNGITGIGNYCVFNPIDSNSAATLSNGNLNISFTGAGTGSTRATFGVSSGKWYWEVTPTTVGNGVAIGVLGAGASLTAWPGIVSGILYESPGGSASKNVNGTESSYGASYTNNDIIGVALDCDGGTITFYKNNTSQGSISGIPTVCFPSFSDGSGVTSGAASANFGQQPFAYTPPSGYSALNTQNLSTPTITNGASYMAAVTYTGTNATQSITASTTNSGNNPLAMTFQPDLVWIKGRNVAASHNLFDSVRGPRIHLESNLTDADYTEASGVSLTAFNNNGFALGTDNAGPGQTNANGNTYVAWEWQAGGAPTVNNSAGAENVPTAGSVKINGSNSTSTLAGSIAATRLSANTAAGFSVVTYTGTGANATVGHGLGVKPAMIIVKARSAADNWQVTHQSLNMSNQGLYLNATNAVFTDGDQWNSTQPTSSVFSLGALSGSNTNGRTYVAYLWNAIANYSSFGSYTGNGSADGPFVYLGFRPRWLLIKRTDTAGYNWLIYDTSRNTYNAANLLLWPNNSDAEYTFSAEDFLSNGFKLRTTDASFNASGGTYIYAAFAENPFKISRAR